ncbi:MAG TPA: ABC transporter ATP-binding protein [Stellaceae bacterium]|nr:ABC transporter ATP-binding protein [Stellaceae bacterium]
MHQRVAPRAGEGRAHVVLSRVAKGFGSDGAREDVVADLDFEIPPGELTALVGPSGCGKTTIANLVAGYETPDQGEILLDGAPIRAAGRERMLVFQESALFPWLTTYRNLTFGPLLRRSRPVAEIHAEARRLLQLVGLAAFADKYPAQLSGGMQRRAELARAMMMAPRLMIMDEPFRGLDAMTRELMQLSFLRLFDSFRRTHLFITSEIEEAILLADRLVLLSNRPARVRAVIAIALPRPREIAMLSSRQAFEYKRQALEILHEEALRGFGDSSVGQDLIAAFAEGS